MKHLGFFLCLVLAASVLGCASATVSVGKPFDSAKVAAIQKGKTTIPEIVAWFGEPYTKSVAGADGETWTYYFSQARSVAKNYVYKIDVKTEQTSKKLDLFCRDGVVLNYTLSDGVALTAP